MSLKERIDTFVATARERVPLLDHLIRTLNHYSSVQVNGSLQAGGVTYYAFLSIFPILALAFLVVGYIARYVPEASADLTAAINQVLPGMVGDGAGQISLDSIQSSAAAVGLIGVVGFVYSGLSWVSAMRSALQSVYELPKADQPNFIWGKIRDLATLGCVGLTLVLSVSISGAVTGYSHDLLALVGLSDDLRPLLAALTVIVGLIANMVMFFALFTLLARPLAPRRSLWSGALLGAVGFEVLKWASSYLLASTKEQPAFQAFGITLILLVWINYFSRVVLYSAAWAHTAPRARDRRGQSGAGADAVQHPSSGAGGELEGVTQSGRDDAETAKPGRLPAYLAGAASALAAIALLRQRKEK